MGCLEVLLPEGSVEGEELRVQAPSGELFTLLVPEGACPGMTLHVDFPHSSPQDARAPMPCHSRAASFVETETCEVEVPEGVAPGDPFTIITAYGGTFEVIAPHYATPGMTIQVELPCAPCASSPEPHHPPSRQSSRSSSVGHERRHPLCTTPPTSRVFTDTPSQYAPIAEGSGNSTPPGDLVESSREGAVAPLPSRFGSHTARGRQQQYYYAANNATQTGRSVLQHGTRSCRSHELREPVPGEGFLFYVGQKVQVYRSTALWSIATVLEAHDGFSNFYKCRRTAL